MSRGKPQNKRQKVVPSLVDSFLACKPLLFRLVGKIVRPEEIEDIVQEAFVNSYAASKKQKINNPRAFMVKAARNIALNHLKELDSRKKIEVEEWIDEQFYWYANSVENQCESEEKFVFFCRAVANLPPKCRRVFILIKVYGLGNREVSEYLSLHSSTIEKHVARGMMEVMSYMKLKGQLPGQKTERVAKNERVASFE